VNVHPWDAQEGLLTGPDAPLEPLAKSIVLEIGDRTPQAQIDAFANGVPILRGAGFRVAVDDLGAGGAGLVAFGKLSPDFVKLDGTLISGLDGNEAAAKMTRGMYALCRELGVAVIAEGVETSGERDALARMGADLAQGHVFGEPGATFAPPRI
jgi:EAL domain-containing protein (putative c-di-GMP-specific phosphodiesterase class I)